MILLGPGTSVSHDVLRLLAFHRTALVAVGDNGVRCYTAPPLGPHDSILARKQATLWADEKGGRMLTARRMYFWRLGEMLPDTDLDTLRGIEGARMKKTYQLIAQRFGVPWQGRRYNRSNPSASDDPNQAINHAATAVEAAAIIAVYATGAIPSLGFIHEDAGISFILDIADLYRDSVTLPIAFEACSKIRANPAEMTMDRMVRHLAAEKFRKEQLIPSMIDRIKELIFEE